MLDQNSLQQVVDDVCETMLGLGLQRVDRPVATTDYRATIRILGQTELLVEVGVSTGLARRIAASMFAVDLSHLSIEELHDSLGEVVNMIGGNIKGILGGEADLSLPCVGAADDRTEQTTRCELEVAMGRSGESLTVRLLKLHSATVHA